MARPIKLDRGFLGYKIEKFLDQVTADSNTPVISHGEKWVRVNDMIILESKGKYRLSRKGIVLAYFIRKSWAVAYAVALLKGNLDVCSLLQSQEWKLEKYNEDIRIYKQQLTSYHENNMKKCIISDRLSRAHYDYNQLIDEVGMAIKNQFHV